MGLGVEFGGGAHPLQKSKAFIKNAINWYQKKTQGELKKEAKRGKGREERSGNPGWKKLGR